MITLITPTGGRPEAFKLCELYMSRQTYKGAVQWIVVDDAFPPTVCTREQDYFRGPRAWVEGINTHRFNMEEALKHIDPSSEYILFIEDDDYYSPQYVEAMIGYLQHAEIAGLSNSRYYGLHVPGWKLMKNYAHASLSQTAIRKSMLPRFKQAVDSGDLYFDSYMWKRVVDDFVPCLLVANSSLAVGIKGMPGRAGITGSHRDKGYMVDSQGKKLEEWIGADVKYYTSFMRKTKVLNAPAVPGVASKARTINPTTLPRTNNAKQIVPHFQPIRNKRIGQA